MDLDKFCVKFFAEAESAFRLDAFIPVYHRWIQKHAVEGMLVDVADYGIPAVATRCVTSRDDAVAAAAEIGYPVVLKTDEAAVAHKSDVGGVVLDLADEVAVKAAYDDLAGRLGDRVTVSAMAPAGVELSIGMTRDPAFGPIVVLAAGGIYVELFDDRVVALPPVDDVTARRLVDRLRCRPMLVWRRALA